MWRFLRRVIPSVVSARLGRIPTVPLKDPNDPDNGWVEVPADFRFQHGVWDTCVAKIRRVEDGRIQGLVRWSASLVNWKDVTDGGKVLLMLEAGEQRNVELFRELGRRSSRGVLLRVLDAWADWWSSSLVSTGLGANPSVD